MSKVPYEIYSERVWEVSDPNTARLVAIFYDEDAAADYLKFLNREEDHA